MALASVSSEDIYRALMSIDATLKELLVLSKTKRAATPSPSPADVERARVLPVNSPAAAGVLGMATDADLDSQYCDEKIRFDPRDWTGTMSYKGSKMSECSPEFLDVVAMAFDGLARKNALEGKEYNGKPQADYDKRTAARARGWAARLRAGGGHAQMVTKDEITW